MEQTEDPAKKTGFDYGAFTDPLLWLTTELRA